MCGRQAFGGEKRAVQMDREHLLPLGEGELLDRMHDLDAGIADEDVDAAERGDRRRNARVDRLFAAHVHGYTDGLAARRANLRCRGFRRRLVEVGDGHLGALAGERHRNLLADAAGPAGDDCRFVLELHVVSFRFAAAPPPAALRMLCGCSFATPPCASAK